MEPQLLGYVTATATPDPSHICDLHCSFRQCWMLNSLGEARDHQRENVGSLPCWATVGTPWFTFFFFLFFRASPAVYGSSQARSWIRDAATGLHHIHSNGRIWIASATYTTAHGNTRSLTHGARPGIKPSYSWILVRFVTCWATMGTPPWFTF